MTTETTTIIDLPEITDEMVEFARNRSMIDTFGDLRSFAVAIRLALLAAIPRWEPIELDEIKAGMRIRASAEYRDLVATYIGVAHTDEDGDWRTEGNMLLAGRDPISYEVDPATIPADPDAELIEALREASWRIEHMGGRPDPLPGLPEARDLLTELRELGWTVIRAEEEDVTGDE